MFLLLPPSTKLGQGYVFTRVCDSVHRGVVSQHALQVVSQHALQQVSGGLYPCMPRRSPGPHPGGKLRGLALGGSPGPHLGSIPACTEADTPTPSPSPHGYCCGRYASYWNAFLLTFSPMII